MLQGWKARSTSTYVTTIATIQNATATSIFFLGNRLIAWCHPERWLQAFIEVNSGYLKRIAISERTSAGA
jgi:hypothetical protein